LAGLEPVSAGRVQLDGEDVTHDEPGARDVAMVFQSYALYPHMTVAENIGFPLKMMKRPPAEIAQAVQAAAARVRIDHLLARRPGQLSGGQQQRVALARAIVRQPRIFLLDEPLSNLDAKLRLETRLELRELQRDLGVTTVYVTHDQEEAMTLADRIAVFMEGRIVQIGTPREVFGRPAQASVAGFIGTPPMNLLPGAWSGANVTVEGSTHPVATSTPAERTVTLGIRPGDLRLQPQGLAARVLYVEELGDHAILNVQAGPTRLKVKVNGLSPVNEGDTVHLGFEPEAAHLFDPAGIRLA
jgi:ABC-type sugar transport system ATPase subunit